MTRGITIARKGQDFTTIHGPEVLFSEQRRRFSSLRVELAGMFDEVELWSSSGGRVKRYRFKNIPQPTEQVGAPVTSDDSGNSEQASAPSVKRAGKSLKTTKSAAGKTVPAQV